MKTKMVNFFNDYEKEENWLNSMAAKGWHLTHTDSPSYTFEEGLPGEYIYRTALLDHMPNHPDTIDYIRLMEETGAEHVGSIWRWAYFRKKASDGEFEIYTDIESRINHYKRVERLLFWYVVPNFISLVLQLPIAGLVFAFGHTAILPLNAFVASANIAALCITFAPWKKFSEKAKELEREREVYE